MAKLAIIIGVEKYHDSSIPTVRYAKDDSTELKKVLLPLGFLEENISLLIDSKATKTLIESEIKTVTRSLSDQDELIIFYSGHGFTKNNFNYITCHDSSYHDLVDTSIQLQSIFSRVKNSLCQKVIFFLDACHSGLELDENMRDLISEMKVDELKEFFTRAEYYVGFASCKNDEKSYSANAIGHGIWTYHLLEALRGDKTNLLKRRVLLFASDLQNYLTYEVPKSVKKYTTHKYQTPVLFGSQTADFVVADLTNLLEERRRKRLVSKINVDRILFSKESSDSIRKLSGFIKGKHNLPKWYSNSSENFVRDKSEEDIKCTLEKVHSQIKTFFNYKNRDITRNFEAGTGQIITPDFQFNISIEQNKDNIEEYIERYELVNISSNDLLLSHEFNAVFHNSFDTIEFIFQNWIDLNKVIDEIEDEIDNHTIKISVPLDAESCEIIIDSINDNIILTRNMLKITSNNLKSPKELVQSFNEIRKELLTNNVGIKFLS